jgi:hypothetical protein
LLFLLPLLTLVYCRVFRVFCITFRFEACFSCFLFSRRVYFQKIERTLLANGEGGGREVLLVFRRLEAAVWCKQGNQMMDVMSKEQIILIAISSHVAVVQRLALRAVSLEIGTLSRNSTL